MAKEVVVPPKFAVLRDQLVAAALKETMPPEDSEHLEEFGDWLIYEAGDLSDYDLGSVIWLPGVDFLDDDARDALDLPENAEVSDEQRLAYAKKYLAEYDTSGFNEPDFALALPLKRADGASAYYCGVGKICGQGGIQADWHGSSRTKKGFLAALRKGDYYLLTEEVPDQAILDQWRGG